MRPQHAVPTTRETPGTRPAMTWTTRNAAATGVCGNAGDPAREIPAQLDVSPPLKTASVMADTPDDRPRSRMEADKIMLPDAKSTARDEPVEITQTLTTISPQAVRLPSDLGLAGQHARVAVTRPDCAIGRMPGFASGPMGGPPGRDPGTSRIGEADLFWRSLGLAFEHPGRHAVTVSVIWNAQGIPYRLRGCVAVWTDHRFDEADSKGGRAAAAPRSGVAVGPGGVPQPLEEGARRIGAVTDQYPDQASLTTSGACTHQ